MFRKDEFQQHLLGTFEIALYMRSGVERFRAGIDEVLRSFLWPFLVLPIALITAAALSEGYSFWFLFTLHGVRILVTYCLSLFLVFFFCKQVNRLKYLYKYIIIQNWFELAMLALILPILIMIGWGIPMAQLTNYAIFITLLSYVYSGFILTYALRIPWEMGGFIAISFMFIEETGFDVMVYIRDSFYTT